MTKKEILQDLLTRVNDRLNEIDEHFNNNLLDMKMKKATRVFELLTYKSAIEHTIWIDGILKLCRTGK
jgi:hypothetical protein